MDYIKKKEKKKKIWLDRRNNKYIIVCDARYLKLYG